MGPSRSSRHRPAAKLTGFGPSEQVALPPVQAFGGQGFSPVGGRIGRDQGDAGFDVLALDGMPRPASDATPDGCPDFPWVRVFSLDAAADHGGSGEVPHGGFSAGQEAGGEDLPHDLVLPQTGPRQRVRDGFRIPPAVGPVSELVNISLHNTDQAVKKLDHTVRDIPTAPLNGSQDVAILGALADMP